LVGFQTERFGQFLGIMMMCNVASIMMGLAISAIAPDVDTATALGMPAMIIGKCEIFAQTVAASNCS